MAELPKSYDPNQYERVNSAIDVAVFTMVDDVLKVLLTKRAEAPYKNKWSLVGGYIKPSVDKTLESCAARKVSEKTGVTLPYVEQIQTVGSHKRDPRGWTVSILYLSLIPFQAISQNFQKSDWVNYEEASAQNLAFDHNELLIGSRDRLKSKATYSDLPLVLLDHKFTLSEAKRCFEVVLGSSIQTKSFRRRIDKNVNIESTGERVSTGRRKAELFRKISTEINFYTRTLESVSK